MTKIKKSIPSHIKKLLHKGRGEWEQIDLSKADHVPPNCTAVYKNNKFMVFIYEKMPTTKGPATRVLVRKHDDYPIIGHWAEMFRIKNELFGEDVTAVEYYPSKKELVDEHNIYWFWIFPNDVLPIPIM